MNLFQTTSLLLIGALLPASAKLSKEQVASVVQTESVTIPTPGEFFAAIDKVGKQAFDEMTLDEIKLLMACHSLLTSRLEPTMRDQRLRRILDGAIKILQKRKDSMEGL